MLLIKADVLGHSLSYGEGYLTLRKGISSLPVGRIYEEQYHFTFPFDLAKAKSAIKTEIILLFINPLDFGKNLRVFK